MTVNWKRLNTEVALIDLMARFKNGSITPEAMAEKAFERGVEAGARMRHVRSVTLRALYGQSMLERPGVPDEKTARRAVELVVEESLELMKAFLYEGFAGSMNVLTTHEKIEEVEEELLCLVHGAPIGVDLPKLADALEDIDVVVDQARLAFGIDGAPIADAVFNANMTKGNGPVDPVTGKRLKPDGFVPPDIAAELKKQGWRS